MALCKAGYKGPVTEANPQGSIDAHHQIIRMSTTFLCQHGLGVVADGAWGPKSEEKCKAFEKLHGLPESGIPSITLLEKLYS